MKFTQPDESTIKRMTPAGIRSLLDTLKTQRETLVKPYDTQIKFYEDLLAKKEKENAEATS